MRAIISAAAALRTAGARCSRETGAVRNDKLPTPDASPADKSASSRSAAIKIGGTYSVVGSYQGHTVYKNDAGKYFWIDKATGDQKFVSSDAVIKQGSARSAAVKSAYKEQGKVTIVGKDPKGHVIQQNARGQKFYLDPATGDMVFVK